MGDLARLHTLQCESYGNPDLQTELTVQERTSESHRFSFAHDEIDKQPSIRCSCFRASCAKDNARALHVLSAGLQWRGSASMGKS